MTISAHSLVMMVTMGCNSRCGHCCLLASPERIGEHLSTDEMIDYIKDAYKVGIGSVIFTGGEPMLYLVEMHKPLALAYSLGMFIDIRTNASWAKNKATTRKVFRYLKSVGLGRLGLSYDSYHAAYIDVTHIKNAIEIAQEMGTDFYLDWMGSETEEEVTEYLCIDKARLRFLGEPLKVGRARMLSDKHFNIIPIKDAEKDNYNCTSESSPTFTVFPNGYGSFHQCCWVHPYLIRGLWHGRWIEALVEEMENDYAVEVLASCGVAGLIRWAREEKPDLLKAYYSHPCEVCYDLLGEIQEPVVKRKTVLTARGIR